MWRNRSNPTITNKNLYESASNSFEKLIVEIQNLDLSIKEIEKYLENGSTIYTWKRFNSNWKKD